MSNNQEEIKTILLNNLEKMRRNMSNIRGVGEYMKKYSTNSKVIEGMAEDRENTCKVLLSLLLN